MKRFLSILQARNLEFVRDRAALSWTLIMPFLLVIGFAVIFSEEDKTFYKVGLIADQQQVQQSTLAFFSTKHISFVPYDDEKLALDKLRHHQLDMVIEIENQSRYWINLSSPTGYIVERILWGSGGQDFKKQTVDGQIIRYVDWVLPGILAFNIMMGCLFGVGYVIVRYRKSGFLKRLKATPLTSLEFLLAQMTSRLILMMAITLMVYIGCDLFLDFNMQGSYLLLFVTALLGAVCMISLGLLVAAQISSEELAGGILNLLTWPMMILSGVWFSLEGTHVYVQYLAQLLPLTHLVDSARAIMTEGAGLHEVGINLLVLLIMSVVFLVIGAKRFRWE